MSPAAHAHHLCHLSKSVVEPKFMCLTHSEAKQAETSESGGEKGLLQGQARRMGSSCSKSPNSQRVLREEFLSAKFEGRSARYVTII